MKTVSAFKTVKMEVLIVQGAINNEFFRGMTEERSVEDLATVRHERLLEIDGAIGTYTGAL
jgi:hypothetical protein